MNPILPKEKHLEKAGRDRNFASSVQESLPDSSEWSATAYFYSAMHLFDTFLHDTVSRTGQRLPDTHEARRSYVSTLLPEVERERYLNLYGLSRRARYNTVRIPEGELQDAVSNDYEPLVDYLKKRLRATSAQ